MFIPYQYDQLNRASFERATKNNELVIQEFRQVFETLLTNECGAQTKGAQSSCSALYEGLKQRKLIALDYIENMQRSMKLELWTFAKAVGLFLFLLLLGLGFALWIFWGAAARFLTIFGFFSVAFSAMDLLDVLPHTNTKFYYTMGTAYGVILGLMDYVHNVDVALALPNGDTNNVAVALGRRHEKWSQMFTACLAIILTLVGTISFNLINYLQAVFGSSFIFYPLIGIIVATLVAIMGFYWGVLRNILSILGELEQNLANIK